MPTTDSADKRARQNQKRRQQNKEARTYARSQVRKFEDALEAGQIEEAQQLLKQAESALDRAVSKGVIPKNRASRKISRLAKRLNKALDEA